MLSPDPGRQSTRMSKTGLDQYGTELFEQQEFGTAGVKGVKYLNTRHNSKQQYVTIVNVSHLECASADQAVRHQAPPTTLCHLHWSPSDRYCCQCYLSQAPALWWFHRYILPQYLPPHFPVFHYHHVDTMLQNQL